VPPAGSVTVVAGLSVTTRLAGTLVRLSISVPLAPLTEAIFEVQPIANPLDPVIENDRVLFPSMVQPGSDLRCATWSPSARLLKKMNVAEENPLHEPRCRVGPRRRGHSWPTGRRCRRR
jgi:hypothetical protein